MLALRQHGDPHLPLSVADAARVTGSPTPALTVALLCCNERSNLARYLPEVEQALVRLGGPVEIVVVDDGSDDGTGAWLAGREHAVPLRTVRHERRRGYGAAVRTAIEAGESAWVAMLDGDGQFLAAELEGLVALRDEAGADLVGGVRADRRDSLARRALGATYNGLMRAVTRTRYADLDCGFKLGRRAALKALQLRCDGNLVGAELYAKADRAGLRVAQRPVTHRPRLEGRAKGADAFAVVNAAVEFVRWFDVLRPPR